MTEEEAERRWTNWGQRPPKISVGAEGGFSSEHRARMVTLDEQTARFLNAKATAAHQTPSELAASMARKELAHTY
jgi:hypothetical protein